MNTEPALALTARQIVDVTGVTYRQLDFWTRVGHIHAAPRDPDAGSGIPRTYSAELVPVLRIAAKLTAAGLHAEAAVRTARVLADHGQAELGGYLLTPKGAA